MSRSMIGGQSGKAVSPHVWETLCGLLISGDSDTGHGLYAGNCSYCGTLYCVENGNPLVRCPHGRKECSAIPTGFPLPMCPCHRANCSYNYEHSLERLSEEISEETKRQYLEITGGRYCACVELDNGMVKVQYDVKRCIQQRCRNDFCVVRKLPRDLHMVNIYYDVRRTWVSRTGLLEDTRTTLTKGVRVFPKAVARTDAELWLKSNSDYGPLQSKSSFQGPSTTPGAGIHDFSEFHYLVENIRIAHSDRRDAQKDQQDIDGGIQVVHAADQKKAEADERRAARALSRKRRASGGSQELHETMEQIELF